MDFAPFCAKEVVHGLAPQLVVIRALNLCIGYSTHRNELTCVAATHTWYMDFDEKKLAAYSIRPKGIRETGMSDSLPSSLIVPSALASIARTFDLPNW